MFKYTKNNHYQFRYDDSWLPQTKDFKNFYWKLGHVIDQEKTLSWREECINAAKNMKQQAGREEITIAFSGGIDSEIAALSFLESGIKISLSFMKFKYDINEYDFRYTKHFASKHNLKLNIFELDLFDFLHNEAHTYIDQYMLTSPQYPTHLWLLDQLDCYVVFCGGDLRLYRRSNSKDRYYIIISTQSTAIFRRMLDTGKIGSPFFHIHSPEQVYSFLNDPITKLWLKQSYSMKQDNIKWFKPVIYENSFPGLKPRTKKTGFELVQGYDDNFLRPKLKKENSKRNRFSDFDLENLLLMLTNKKTDFINVV